MRIRHKQPTLVSMWMLDVFCCALGCVTLLFLLNSRMASDEANANRTALIDLQTIREKLAAAVTSLDATRLKLNSEELGRRKLSASVSELEGMKLKLTAEVEQLTRLLSTARTEKDDLAKKLSTAQIDAKDAKALLDKTQLALNSAEAKNVADAKELATIREKTTDADDLLRKKQKEVDVLAKKLMDSTTAFDDLTRLLRKKDDERATMVKQTSDLQKMLDDLNAKLAAANKQLETTAMAAKLAAAKAEADLTTVKTKTSEELATARAQAKELLKKVDDANASIIDLQGDKQKIADKFDKFQKETEARFAGIVMSGKRVVFLVDISGSMGKKDANTADPTKWPIVTETVTKVMRSIPGLEKYQVIIFSSAAKWLFGTGDWIDYRGARSLEDVSTALLKVKPYDDTNLYAGLELAFRLRPSGLDAVYLFSDGLPTSGPGLTVAEQNRQPPLSELELGERLGKYIRGTLNSDWNRMIPGKPKVMIHSVGFYFDSPDVGAFLWSLSRENGGSFVGMSKP
ncbi:MAG TPA: VWA domain-containing protein [Gemmata sp.]|nr:VWA domain-containing protein [Gemmata sp.]